MHQLDDQARARKIRCGQAACVQSEDRALVVAGAFERRRFATQRVSTEWPSRVSFSGSRPAAAKPIATQAE